MFIFLIGQLQILASALQEMRISSFRTKSQRVSTELSDQGMPTGIIPNSLSHEEPTMPGTSSRAFKISAAEHVHAG